MANPKFLSIVVPTHNRAVRIVALVRTLLGRGGWDELIVVDDGSEIEVAAAAGELASDRIHVIRHPSSRGPAGARNTGWKRAQGEVILFLDDDVEPLPGAIDRHVEFHRGTPDPMAIRIGRLGWPDDSSRTHFMTYLSESPFGPFNPGRPVSPGQEWRRMTTSAVSLKRETLEKTGGFDECFTGPWGEDSEFAWRLSRVGARFSAAEDILFRHHKVYRLEDYCEGLRRNADATIRLETKCSPDWRPPWMECGFDPQRFRSLLGLATEMESELDLYERDAFGRIGLTNALWEVYRAATAWAHNQAIADTWRKQEN